MSARGFQYSAVTSRNRRVHNCLWFPAFLPERWAWALAWVFLYFAYDEVDKLEQDQELSLQVNPGPVTHFIRRLSVMMGSGIALHGAVNFLSESEDENMNLAARRLLTLIESGHSFANSLAKLPGVFPPIFIGYARSGEASGKLVKSLENMATQMERTENLKRRLKSALAYPVFLMLGAVLLSGLLIFCIVPMMAPALQEMGVELPALTRWMLNITYYGSQPLVFLPLMLSIAVVTTVCTFVMSTTGRYTRVRRRIDQLQLELPVVNRLAQQYCSTRVLSAAAMSVETGIPVTTSLTEASTLAGNIILEERVLGICRDIGEGMPLEQALETNSAFRHGETQVLICGSEAGNLAASMASMAKFAEEELDTSIDIMTALLEPLILAFMSLVVGTVSLATFLPWLSLLRSIL